MKFLLSVIAFAFGASAFAAGPSYFCQASKKADYYDSYTHWELSFTKTLMKMNRVYFNPLVGDRDVDTFVFKTKGALAEGKSAVTGMMIYNGEITTGDSPITTIYVTKELRDGGVPFPKTGKIGGVFKFIGLHYAYETYYCFRK